jgi:hypothetical protein
MKMCFQVQQQLELAGRWVGDTYFSFCRAIVFAILADIASMWKPWTVPCLKDVEISKHKRSFQVYSVVVVESRYKRGSVDAHAHAHTSLQKQTP